MDIMKIIEDYREELKAEMEKNCSALSEFEFEEWKSDDGSLYYSYDEEKFDEIWDEGRFIGIQLEALNTLLARINSENFMPIIHKYESKHFGNMATIESMMGSPYKGAPKRVEWRLCLYAMYDEEKLYYCAMFESFEEAYAELMKTSCGEWEIITGLEEE